MEKTVEQLEGDLKIANEKISSLETELSTAQTMLAGISEENDSLKKEVDRLLNTDDKEEKKTGVGETFDHNGEKYELLCSSMRIPGIGKLTALEILTNEKAKAWLVGKQSGMIKKKI